MVDAFVFREDGSVGDGLSRDGIRESKGRSVNFPICGARGGRLGRKRQADIDADGEERLRGVSYWAR